MTSHCEFEGIYFVFSSDPQDEERTPSHIAAHLQSRTSRHSKQRIVKELQFSRRKTKN